MREDWPINAEGNWEELRAERFARGGGRRPALFLDRDGVVVKEVGYLGDPKDLRLLEPAAELIAAANRREIPVVLVTNQSGIGRGYFGWSDFAGVQARLHRELAARDAVLDMVLACPFHPEARASFRHPAHPWRKPRPGMLLRGAERLPIALGRSWIIGDQPRDLEAGRAAGLAVGILVLGGHGRGQEETAKSLETRDFSVILKPSAGASLGILGRLDPAG